MRERSELLRRAQRHAVWRVRRTLTVAVDALRRGDRTVVMTPPVGLRFGNWMYLWLHAHRASRAGAPTRVLEAPGMGPWTQAFPGLGSLTVASSGVRFHDRRTWDHEYRYQRFGVDFTADEVDSFVREMIAPHVPSARAGTLVVNVRRGDYYTGGAQDRFGFDQVGYIGAALKIAPRADLITVVSDDPEWCRTNLDRLLADVARRVEFAEPDPVANFLQIAGARSIIGTNSTFSYWGAHVAVAIQPDARIIMPRFHARLDGGSDAYQLDPRWKVIGGFH